MSIEIKVHTYTHTHTQVNAEATRELVTGVTCEDRTAVFVMQLPEWLPSCYVLVCNVLSFKI